MENVGGGTADESLTFTKQMAALYRPDGKERVLEFNYTDIGKSFQLLLTPGGSQVISDGFRPYTTKIETPFSVWKSIGKGEISGQEALYKHLFRVAGDFSVMLDWDKLFGAAQIKRASENTGNVRRTNMFVLLIPWIIFCSAAPVSAKWGGVISIIAASLMPAAWCFCKPVVYERATAAIVTVLSLCAVFNCDIRVIMPLSYGIFGAMWLLSVFLKTPLTAYYSSNDYGLESAFKNPLFMHTNRILTAAWGVLYLFTALWTYALMGTAVASYSGLINIAAPALMGVFTAWFQKWYPAKYAAKG